MHCRAASEVSNGEPSKVMKSNV